MDEKSNNCPINRTSDKGEKMRFHDLAEELLSSRTKVAILKILLRYPGKKFSGRDIARLSGASPSRASEILDLF